MASHRTPLIAGNWKMFKTTAEAAQFTQALASQVASLPAQALPDILICPSFLSLATVLQTLQNTSSPIQVAAQTMESRPNGAYTGEVSPVMLQDIGVQWVLIGHSERRQYYNETDETVNQKAHAALAHQLTPILCVGETLAQREAGQTDAVIEHQVRQAVQGIESAALNQLVFAYEPVWAIGTGKTCESAEANRVCGLIRNTLASMGPSEQVRILYGGSVKPDNTAELLSQSDIDGALVGGASLEPDSFFKIIQPACVAKV